MLETLLVNLGVSYLKPLKFHPNRIMCPGAGLGHHAPRGLRVQAPAPLLAPQRGVPAERAQGRQAAARPARPIRGVALHHHRGGAGQGGFTFRVYNHGEASCPALVLRRLFLHPAGVGRHLHRGGPHRVGHQPPGQGGGQAARHRPALRGVEAQGDN